MAGKTVYVFMSYTYLFTFLEFRILEFNDVMLCFDCQFQKPRDKSAGCVHVANQHESGFFFILLSFYLFFIINEMKRIHENIKIESTDYDEEECAIKAEYCKGWNEKPPQTNSWLSPRQSSKERKHMSVVESLTLSFELKQQRTLDESVGRNSRDPCRKVQDWIQLKQQAEHSTNIISSSKKEESENLGKIIVVKKEALSETKQALIEANQLELCIPLLEANASETNPKKLIKKKRSGKPSPKKESKKHVLETDPEIIRRRQKQIDYGKNTEGYRCYLQTVSKKERSLGDPRTPPLKQKFSRRHWDSMVRTWRLQLHEWDPPSTEVFSLDRDGDESDPLSNSQKQENTSLMIENEVSSQENEETRLEKAYKQITHRIKVQRAMMSRISQRLDESSPSKVSEELKCVDQHTNITLKDQEKTENCQTASAGSDW